MDLVTGRGEAVTTTVTPSCEEGQFASIGDGGIWTTWFSGQQEGASMTNLAELVADAKDTLHR